MRNPLLRKEVFVKLTTPFLVYSLPSWALPQTGMIKETMVYQVSRFYLFRQDLPSLFLACRLTICRFSAFGSQKTEAKRVGSTRGLITGHFDPLEQLFEFKGRRQASLFSKCRLEVVFSCWLFNQSFIVLPAGEARISASSGRD